MLFLAVDHDEFLTELPNVLHASLQCRIICLPGEDVAFD